MLSEIELVLGHGARLDAWAATASRRLGELVPAFQEPLEANRRDELIHARELTALAPYPTPVAYSECIGISACGSDPLWNALLLNFVEDRSVYQFRSIARQFRAGARAILLAIAEDERRHVRLGHEVLVSLGALPMHVGRVLSFVQACDATLPLIDHRELMKLNERIAQRLRESLATRRVVVRGGIVDQEPVASGGDGTQRGTPSPRGDG